MAQSVLTSLHFSLWGPGTTKNLYCSITTVNNVSATPSFVLRPARGVFRQLRHPCTLRPPPAPRELQNKDFPMQVWQVAVFFLRSRTYYILGNQEHDGKMANRVCWAPPENHFKREIYLMRQLKEISAWGCIVCMYTTFRLNLVRLRPENLFTVSCWPEN